METSVVKRSVLVRLAWVSAAGATLTLMLYMFLFSPHYQLYDRLFAPQSVEAAEFKPFGGDFLSEWVGGTIVRADRSRLYDAQHASRIQHDPAVVGFQWNDDSVLYLFYPPVYYAIVSPLSLLSLANGAVVWLALMWAALLAAWGLVRAGAPASVRIAMLLIMCGFGPAVHSLNSGQKGTLWLLLFVAVGVLLARQRFFLAGLVFGLLALKPPLLLGVGAFMLLKRQWRFVCGTAATLTVLVCGSLLMGFDVCRSYVEMLSAAPDLALLPTYPITEENCWFGQLVMLLRPLGLAVWAKPMSAVLMLGSLCAALIVFRGPLETGRKDFLLRFSLLVLLVPLTSPKFVRYDLSIALFPIWMLASAIISKLPGVFHSRCAIVVMVAYLLLSHPAAVAARFGLQPSVFVCLGLLLATRPLARALYGEASPRP